MSTTLKKMLEEIADNPEKMNELTDEQVEELWKQENPYKTSLSPDDPRILAMSYTNLSEEYQTKFLTTAFVGFMYRRAKEFNIMPHKDDETKENTVAREVIMKFLGSMFEYNPDRHVQECAKVPKTEPELDLAKRAMAMDVPGEILPSDSVVIAAVDKKLVGSNTVPNDTFAWFKMYKNDNFEQLRWATMALYGVLPTTELMVQPAEIFNGKNPYEEYKVYEQMVKETTDVSITAVTFGTWNILGPFQQNKDKVSFLNKNTEILQRILEQHKADEQIGADLLKRRVRERKKENIRREGADAKDLDSHLADLPHEGLGATRLLSKEEKEKLAEEITIENSDDKLAADAAAVLGDLLAPDAPVDNPVLKAPEIDPKEYNNDYSPPEDAITVNVYKTDKKKGLQKTHFFTEAIAPDEEKRLADERFEQLSAAEKKELEIKREAEKTVKAKFPAGKLPATKKGGSRK